LNWLSDSSHRSSSPKRRAKVGRSSMDGSFRRPSPKCGTTAGHPLILDGLCLHVLSSFQRTDRWPLSGRPPTVGQTVRRRTFQTYDKRLPSVNPMQRPFPTGTPAVAPPASVSAGFRCWLSCRETAVRGRASVNREQPAAAQAAGTARRGPSTI
jgi:hypothetical protein